MVTVLLILIPSLSALLFGLLTFLILKHPFFRRLSSPLGIMIGLIVFNIAMLIGAWTGIVVSCEINRVFFDWKVLSEALPSGIYLWYGYGPDLTPQFAEYYVYVSWVRRIAVAGFTYLIWLRHRQISNLNPVAA